MVARPETEQLERLLLGERAGPRQARLRSARPSRRHLRFGADVTSRSARAPARRSARGRPAIRARGAGHADRGTGPPALEHHRHGDAGYAVQILVLGDRVPDRPCVARSPRRVCARSVWRLGRQSRQRQPLQERAPPPPAGVRAAAPCRVPPAASPGAVRSSAPRTSVCGLTRAATIVSSSAAQSATASSTVSRVASASASIADEHACTTSSSARATAPSSESLSPSE